MKTRKYGQLAASRIISLAVLGATLAAGAARADEGPWQVLLRGVYLDPADKSDAIPSLKVPGDGVHVDKKWLADLGLEYLFTPNWSAEFTVTYPVAENLSLNGLGIGSFKQMPTTLTGKYRFLPDQDFQPYLGAGIHLTSLSDVNLAIPSVGQAGLSSTSWGSVLQAGFDYRFAPHWFVNADVKWLKEKSDFDVAGAGKVATLHIDPFLFGIGVAFRFGGHDAPAPAPMAAAPVPPPPPAPAPAPAPAAPVVAAPPCKPPAGFKVDANCNIIDQTLVVRAVDFEFNSVKLTGPAQQTLDEVAAALKAQPGLSVEIQGHTDSRGSAPYNLKLSQRRADAVKAYLVSQGVTATALSAKGYGKTQPIASNDTDTGRAQNRRVAFEVSNAPAHVKVRSEGASMASTEAAQSGDAAKTAKPHRKKKQ